MSAKRYRAVLTRSCRTEAMAIALLGAVSPDNAGYVEASRTGSTLTFHLATDSLGELRRSADDLLACLGTAEKVWLRATPTPGGTRSGRKTTP